jgi:hypothetical protein
MKSFLKKRLFTRVFVIAIAILFFSPALMEAAVINPEELEDTDLFELDATVMESHVWSGYIIVAEEKIEFMRYRKGGHLYETLVCNSGGRKIRFQDLKEGNRVYIRGYGLSDDRLVAREIYRLPKKANRKDYARFPFLKGFVELEPVD